MPLDIKKITDEITGVLPDVNREFLEEIILRAAIHKMMTDAKDSGTGFSAQIMPTLRQGDHTVVMITYTNPDGSVRRMGTMIMPDPYIPEFLAHFGIM